MAQLLSIVMIIIASLLPMQSTHMPDENIVDKTYCTQAIDYGSLDELKLDLLVNAKRMAVDEIFGEMIVASTAVDNFVVTSNQIRVSSLGLIRIDGDIEYYNGENLADVCVRIRAYVTDAELRQFEPIKLTKRYCVSNPDLTTTEIKELANTQAVVQALVDYDRKLQVIPEDSLLQLLQQVNFVDSGFISETETYCTRVTGSVVPIEIIAALEAHKSLTTSTSVTQWASQVFAYSNQYDGGDWSASQVLGAPNIDRCGDLEGSWTTNEGGLHFVEVGFEQSVYPEKLIVRENNGVGFVTKLEFMKPGGDYLTVEVTDTLTDCPGDAIFEVSDRIDFPVNRVKIHINADHTLTYEEIDAIAIVGNLAETQSETESD